MTKQEAINRVNEGVGSIYTKEDVTNLINQIEEVEEGRKVGLTSEEEKIIDERIEYYFDNEDYTDDIDELVSFVIDGGEIDGEKYDLIKKYIKKNK